MQEVWGETEGLVRVWVYAGGDAGGALSWREEQRIVTDVLLDNDSSIWSTWFMPEPEDAFARNPRHFVIDRDGLLVFAGNNLDADSEDAAIAAALAR